MRSLIPVFAAGFLLVVNPCLPLAAGPREISGIHPHLAYFNEGGECGTGAVVPWAGRLWLVTYSPHAPQGSTDKLYEISPELELTVRPESIGGTPANRMIHRESQQLFIGPYAIDANGKVRTIPYEQMPGRPTGNARHLTDPANRIYYASMEEGFYEVNVHTLEVTTLYADNQPGADRIAAPGEPPYAPLPGYHGKGFYSGQGRVVYANNGENSAAARRRPDVDSGCLAEWDGRDWRVVRRNQFTEVTGPGGIHGNANPATDPLWSVGWDHRSLILMALEGGEWQAWRLPKASHCYDGAHGWNTEWPRIREVGGEGLLMTMHGMFWRFPRDFGAGRSAGIRPRSTYLKVIGDFCRWQDRLVFGCDDTAKSEFLNKRKAKGDIAAPGQSHSNLWFTEPGRVDELGPPLGRGAVWLDEAVRANTPSDAFLFAGFDHRGVHLTHDAGVPVRFYFEVDREGNDRWTSLREVTVPAKGYQWVGFADGDKGAWVRVRLDRDCDHVTAFFAFANRDPRPDRGDDRFAGLAQPEDRDLCGGLIRARGANLRTLGFSARQVGDGRPSAAAYYELDGDCRLRPVDDPQAQAFLEANTQVPDDVLEVDAASVLYVDDDGNRWRLPKGDAAFDAPGWLGPERIDREVVTERDLFNCHGTFYELPARNAGGFALIRPIATHNRRITDYCSYRGLLLLTGVKATAAASQHILRSTDGEVALWAGAVDDLWGLGKPRGHGGPWKDATVKAGVPSDPYLMTGFDRKSLRLSHSGADAVNFEVQVDISGAGLWRTWKGYRVSAGGELRDRFPDGFQAYWVRVVADRDTRATATFTYE